MLLNHKSTIEHILSDSEEYKQLNINNLIDLHSLLISKLAIDKHIRRRLVGITGTNYRPLDNEFQIKEALEKTFDLVNNESDPFTKAILVSALLDYIQAFEDANKRLSRMTTNAILIAHNYCPLSYRSIDVNEYKKAILLFYEQNNIKYLKELLINQYEFAVNNYFCI
jgi:Fic family protein